MASLPSRPPQIHRRRPNRPTEAVPEPAAPEALSPLEPFAAGADLAEAHAGWEARRADLPASVQVIVRVSEDGYVPPCVEMRARISEVLFTAQLASGDIEQLRTDPRVVSVGFSRSVGPAADG
jgi:hypothetical protein